MSSGENLESEPGKRVCPACRYLCPGEAVICENCGILLPEDIESNGHHRRGKECNESLVTALLTGPFIWLYTIRRNWWKFGISVLLVVSGVLALVVGSVRTGERGADYIVAGIAMIVISWWWAILDTLLWQWDFGSRKEQ